MNRLQGMWPAAGDLLTFLGNNMALLKWTSILAPISFLVVLDILRHTLFIETSHSILGFAAVHATVGLAVIAFSLTLFGIIERLQQRTSRQNRQLSALNDIAKASAEQLHLESLLSSSLDRVLVNIGADAGLICLVDLEREEHTVVCSSGFTEKLARSIQRAKLKDDPIASEVVRTGRPVVFERVFDDPQVVAVARREGVRSGISAPLKSEGEVNGILAIASRTERRFSSADQEFLEGIGGQLGMAIGHAVLYEQTQNQNRELGALLAIGKVATSSFDLEDLLARSLDTVIAVTSAQAAEIWLTDADGNPTMRCHRGLHPEAFLERTRFNVGEGVPGIAVQTRQPIFIHNLQDDLRFQRPEVVQAGFHAFCAMPLQYQDKPLGVLTVAATSPDTFDEQRDSRLLEGISEWLALAIENARLYQQVQNVAILQERERIAREMHDGMAQLLGYINTQTIAVKKLIASEERPRALEELTHMEEITRDLYADVREGILGLRTAAQSSGNGGLLSALREYVERYMDMSGVQVEVSASPAVQALRLSVPVELQLMRIVQEALTNVRKHSRATQAQVSFEKSPGGLTVRIRDNGQGFDLLRLPMTGWPRFGLHTMRERAEAVGGELEIVTAPGQGTTVEVRVPSREETVAP